MRNASRRMIKASMQELASPHKRVTQPKAAPFRVQPPYDQRLPDGYWESLRTRKTRWWKPGLQRTESPPHGFNPRWLSVTGIAALLLIALVTSLPHPQGPLTTGATVPLTTQATPQATPPLATGATASWVAGHSYWVKMPDGRSIIINFKGWIDHACNLPRQRGINNAAYTDLATGLTWIWTVPAGASNIPAWIDP